GPCPTPLLSLGRRKLMPCFEHVTCSEPTVTPIVSAICSRLIPRSIRFLICSSRSGVNLIDRPLAFISWDSFCIGSLALALRPQRGPTTTPVTQDESVNSSRIISNRARAQRSISKFWKLHSALRTYESRRKDCSQQPAPPLWPSSR